MNSLYFVNLFLMEINFRIKAGILVGNSKYLRDREIYFFRSRNTLDIITKVLLLQVKCFPSAWLNVYYS